MADSFAVNTCERYAVVTDADRQGGVRRFFYSESDTLVGVLYDGPSVVADLRIWLTGRGVSSGNLEGCDAVWEGARVQCDAGGRG